MILNYNGYDVKIDYDQSGNGAYFSEYINFNMVDDDIVMNVEICFV